MICVSVIFDIKPSRWGYRGDPYLWEDLREHFRKFRFPITETMFIDEFKSYFMKKTGKEINYEDTIIVEEYKHGGMTSGGIRTDFWRKKALPLLVERLGEFNEVNTLAYTNHYDNLRKKYSAIYRLLPKGSTKRNSINYEYVSYIQQIMSFYLISDVDNTVIFSNRAIRLYDETEELTDYHYSSLSFIRYLLLQVIYGGEVEYDMLLKAEEIVKKIDTTKFP